MSVRSHEGGSKDPYAFRIELSGFGIGLGKVVFAGPPWAMTLMHLDIGLSFDKRPAAGRG
jgi:hypothetical protein